MAALNLNRRRSTVTRLADRPDSCEVRVLLNGNAIYPQLAVVKEALPVEPSVLMLTPSDYNGTWDMGADTSLELFVQGIDSERGKVDGTLMAALISGGVSKFKGKVSNGDELKGIFRGTNISLPIIGKFKIQLSVQLTDSTHFVGTGKYLRGGVPGIFPINAVKF